MERRGVARPRSRDARRVELALGLGAGGVVVTNATPESDGADITALPDNWEEPPDQPAVISSCCGSAGVTSGPLSPRWTFTSLRIPNSPGR
jgi:hypothetical protein